MKPKVTLTDFLLHVGPNGDKDSCALLRLPGDEWIDEGYSSVRATSAKTFEVELVTASKTIVLSGVLSRHVNAIREQGLFVIQRKSPHEDPETVLLGWRAC